MSERGHRLLCVSDDAKPESESEMYISDVVRDGPETQALISIKRIRADELSGLARNFGDVFVAC